MTVEKGADRIALVTITREKALNALNAQVLDELMATFEALKTDDQVGAIIVTGSGEKSFVAGADIKELSTLDAMGARRTADRGQAIFRAIENMPKPVIAAVNGFALGGGCELALACHLRVASDNAKLGLPEVGLGLIPGYGGTQRLPRIVGKGIALELILTGGMIKADRAYAIGLVNHVTPAAELLDKARELAAKMLDKAPIALACALEAVNRGLQMSQTDGENLEANLFGLLPSTEDTAEGLAAFIEKRKPAFKGK